MTREKLPSYWKRQLMDFLYEWILLVTIIVVPFVVAFLVVVTALLVRGSQ